MGDDRPARYETEGDVVVYRASSLGRCVRELQAIRHGLEPTSVPGWMQDRYDAGNDFEPLVLQRITLGHGAAFPLRDGSQATCTITETQAEVEVKAYGNVVVRGHVDALGTISSVGQTFGVSKGVIEVKALGPTYWNSWIKDGLDGLPRTYAWQVSSYMLGVDGPCLLVCGQKCKGDGEAGEEYLGEVVGELYTTPPISLSQIKARVIDVEESEGVGVCDVAQYPCGFQWLGGGKCEVQPRVEVHDRAFGQMVHAYDVLRSQVAGAGREMRALRDAIRDRMVELGEGDRLRMGIYNVSWREEEVPESFRKAYKRTVLDVREKKGRDDND